MNSSLVFDKIERDGPCLPRDVVESLGGTTFLASAILSDLVDSKKIKISYGKIGGSPLYYIKSQKEKLEQLYSYLHEKEQQAYDLLKEKKVLRNSNLDPVMRTAIKELKDFAIPVEVILKDKTELFWRWHLLENDKIKDLIKQNITSEQSPFNQEKQQIETMPFKQSTSTEEKKEIGKETMIRSETEKKETKSKKTRVQNIKKQVENTLLSEATNFLEGKNIQIMEQNTSKRNSEIDLIIKIPSAIGELNYYCKVFCKKKCNEKDFSSVYVEGQSRKLPILLLLKGSMTKKAKEMLENDFQTITVVHLP